ncbi:MAG: PIN domain-containing protein [Dehalococcoidia bacterium]
MILVDTSVWIDHLRSGSPTLHEALDEGLVETHPFVIGELACGNLSNRDEVISLMQGLRVAPVATEREALAFIDSRSLMGRGIGYIGVHLLASAALSGSARLWTLDRRLAFIAAELRLSYEE